MKRGESVDDAINLFLMDYKSVQHCTTGKSAWLFYKRKLRTRFRPRVNETVSRNQHAQIVSRKGKERGAFSEGDIIMIDNYEVENVKRTKDREKIVSVDLQGIRYIAPNLPCKRHIDQIIRPVIKR